MLHKFTINNIQFTQFPQENTDYKCSLCIATLKKEKQPLKLAQPASFEVTIPTARFDTFVCEFGCYDWLKTASLDEIKQLLPKIF